ncbi:hypothetical protein A2634_02765 [Candidatus Amesbacteria bacterium RIFCSPHIGHO2_01_FULL_48_32]|nr:MAG: hypothetical protein A2634_02765 [Candidatus Amesbacteria bacterium RIFCSPHIGHO2_01_FULL_48_32]
MTFQMSELGFLLQQLMKISIKHKESDSEVETIAELWVNLMLTQVKANKIIEEEVASNLRGINKSCPPVAKDII